MQGRVLHFYLAGINNQNFLMRDKETGTWWQQVTGKAIYGPMRGVALELVPSDELTFGEWKAEVSDGKVLAPVAKYVKEYDSHWEPKVAKLPVVISFPGMELKSRDVVMPIHVVVLPPSAAPVKPADPAPKPWVLVDATTASEWNFQGCAVSGPAQGKCLDRVPALKDYWFDRRSYHPDTSIYRH